MAGKILEYRGVLEGIQSDQDYVRQLFDLKVGPSRQRCCHYCPCIQWVSTRPRDLGPRNSPELLYTVYGREGQSPTLGCPIIGFVFGFKKFQFI